MIYQITGKQLFPKFRGSLGETLRVPLGRDYFNGNALNFKLNSNADIAKKSHIHYLLPGRITVEGEDNSNHKMFFYGHRSSVLVTGKSQLFFLKCLRNLETGVISVKCKKISPSENLGEEHNIIGVFEGADMHLVATNKGHIYRYDRKDKEITKAYSAGGNSIVMLEAAWKEYGTHVIVAFLSNNKEIYLASVSLFNKQEAGPITSTPMTKYEGKKSSQESPGDFCPNSIDFSQTYDS
jgi:hypothetical protein